ncbi:hypothetical protein F2P79_001820 [Pimephales promelas]|nr:hypothetical protein F2P79_001820 [Pimephales promelas]KAG1970074.1 hypothetical protein F2P79_001820 [Pimephales promelas]
MKVTLVMDLPGYFGDGPAAMRERDFTEAISLRMRVPERLRVGPARHAHEPEDLSAAYSMHIPDRLALTDAPDMSPRPLFSKHASSSWDLHRASWDRDAFTREPVQSPLRRSYSDQGFGRTPPGTPTHSRQTLRSQSPACYRPPGSWASRRPRNSCRSTPPGDARILILHAKLSPFPLTWRIALPFEPMLFSCF